MKRYPRTKQTATGLMLCLLATLLLTGCTGQPNETVPSMEYAPYINAYTGGVISRSSDICIELTQEQSMVELNSELKENPFSFSPPLKGKACWKSNRILQFLPDEGELKPGQLYEGTFQLGEFVEVEKSLKKFRFSFRVQPRSFTMRTETLLLTDEQPETIRLTGEIDFSDNVTPEEVEKMVSAEKKKGGKLPVRVIATDSQTHYRLEIADIPREAEDYQLMLQADGKMAGIDCQQTIQVLIPARDSFRFLSAERIGQPENGIEVVFSSPLSDTQDLKGLIEVPEVPSALLRTEANKVYIYFDNNQTQAVTLKINESVKDRKGRPLGTSHTIAFARQDLNPQVEITTPAVILPDSKNLVVPFRAVNLYAVDLSVIRIFESNVLTFLQNNDLASANELRRAGRLIHKQTLNLAQDPTKDLHSWNNYSIDLAGLIRQEPGAIYRIVLSFTQAYSAYPCGHEESDAGTTGNAPDRLIALNGNRPNEEEEAEWDTPQTYFYYNGGVKMDWEKYDWRQRNNPCHPSYYMSGREACCNVLASNLGVIVKRNSLNKLWITVSNLLDTQPAEKAHITAYNFQLQPIGSTETDKNGFAELTPRGVPFIVMAEWKEQKAYIRVTDGEELSVSRFDVDGKHIQKGLKGFVYGERGVWRPGDTLHVAFMLADREQRIPDNHPVTLELYNARGQFHSKLLSIQGVNGLHVFHLPTRPEDPTGVWNAYVKVGGATFHKSLRIETIKPNRLKISMKCPQEILHLSAREVPFTLSSAWLTGATASNLKVRVELSLAKVNTQFKEYKQYVFNNPATEFTTQTQTVFEGTLDKEGNVVFPLKLPPSTQAPGMLNASLTARVFEPGGDASIYTQELPFSPFASYVGINLNQPEGKYLETDREHRFDIVTVDATGKPTDRSHLEYKIYRIDWSWWWENRNNSFGTYLNSNAHTPVKSGSLHTTGGKASFTFQVNYPEWGRYLVYVKDRDSGHATGGTIYVDWPDWRGRSGRKNPDGIQMLGFSLDKESYATGETATAIIPAAAGGRALVTIENGTTLLKREWIEVNDGQDVRYSFRITPEMAPNAYLHVSLLQPHAQTVNDLPIRMYGIAPITVVDKETILQPKIEMADALRPETEFSVTVSEKSGKPMTYTLAVVDDGLLDLTSFKTPNPWNEFYAREALGIRTWDMYDHVLGASAGCYAALFSTGGDETLKPADAKANRFKPVVKFIGPFSLGKGKRQTHKLKLPMYVGSVRVMVVAGQEGAYGHAEKTVAVKSPLMLLSTLPRVLSTGEEISLPVNLFAMEKEVKQAKVSIQINGAATVIGPSEQSVTFEQPGDRMLSFRLKTGEQTGKVTVRLTAEGNGRQAHETTEITIRNPNPAVTTRSSQWIEAGKSITLPYSLQGGDIARSRMELEVSRIPAADITRRFDFLYDYQHHCTEQLVSKALPLLFIEAFKSMSQQETEKNRQNIQEGIRQLYARQLPNGGFACWPGQAVADEWVTSYTGMFLTLAQEKGYAVNPDILNRWKRFQRVAAQNWQLPQEENWMRRQGEMQQAYRLYTLALAGTPEQGAMNRLKEVTSLSGQARWRLAAAYALTGKKSAAEELAFNAGNQAESYDAGNVVYGSPQRDESMILEALLLMDRKQEALEMARKVSQSLQQEEWFDTQGTAFALLAMARLADKMSGKLEVTWSFDGKQQPKIESDKAVFLQELPIRQAAGNINVTNQGEGAVNVTLVTRTQLLHDTLPPRSNNLRLEVQYSDLTGIPLSTERIQQGSDFMVVVTVTNTSMASDYKDLSLTHILPSGWEIYDSQMEKGSAQPYTYRDIRDDRILTYFDLKRGERKQFRIRLQATYAGDFILPAIQCEHMYNTAAQAQTQAGRTCVSE